MGDKNWYVYGRTEHYSPDYGVVPKPRRNVKIRGKVSLPDDEWTSPPDRTMPSLRCDAERSHAHAASVSMQNSLRSEAAAKGVRPGRLNGRQAFLLFAMVFMVLGMITVANLSARMSANERLVIAKRGESQLIADNQAIHDRIELAKTEVEIGYKAANELGMVHADAARTISLVALEAYPAETAQTGYTAEVVVTGWGQEQLPTVQTTASEETVYAETANAE